MRLTTRGLAAAVAVAMAMATAAGAQARRRAATLEVRGAEARAIVSVDGVRLGRADANGARRVETVAPGRHTVVVRQPGFVDHQQPVTLAAGRSVAVTPKRVPVTDPATLAFQRADDLAFDGKHRDAVPLFREAIASRGAAFPEAGIGLARSLLALKSLDEATAAITAVLEGSPRLAEAHAVAANVLRERGLYDEAAVEYRKAIDLAGGRSPEAHTGLALVLEERGERDKAVAELRTAIAQNHDAEPILYQMLGSSLEELDRKKEAIAAYERFLALAPNHSLAAAVRSVLERLTAKDEGADEGDVNPYAPKP